MDNFFNDITYGIRSLLKHPAFTIIAVLTLTLGIGANTAMFSVINAVLLNPLPYHEPDRLVWMVETGEEVANRSISYPNFVDWRARNNAFEEMSTFRGWPVTMTGGERPVNLDARMVSAGYFRVMHANPLLGRDFSSDDDHPGAAAVTMLSYGFWQNGFGGDPNIVGRVLMLDDRPHTVIGVMPQNFVHQGPPPLWLLSGQQNWNERDVRIAGSVIARLKRGVTIAQASSAINTIADQLKAEYPRHNSGDHRVSVVSLEDSITGRVKPALLILFGAVGLVLLIACSNVANLLLARAATRRREFAVRVALGASRWRIVRQLLIESVMLALAGGTLGLLLAWWSTQFFGKVEAVPRIGTVEISYWVLSFNLLISVLTGVFFGLAPAWRLSKTSPQNTLKDSGSTTTEVSGKRLRGFLVAAEVALSTTLLVGSGLLLKSMMRLVNSDLGFESGQVLTMALKASQAKYPDRSKLNVLQQQLLERVSVLPGVQAACLSTNLPGFRDGWQNDIWPEGHAPLEPGEMINVDWSIVSADYFKTMQLPIVKGRSFSKQESDEGTPVVIVDERLARRFWPNEEAIGKHLKYDSPVWHEIIGVAKTVNIYGSDAQPLIKIYTPFGRFPQRKAVLSIRTAAEAQALTASVTRELQSIDKDLPIGDTTTLEALLAREVSTRRFNTGLFALFGALALILAVTGVYSVISYSVAQRNHEVGIRVALGAGRREVLKLFIGQGMRLVVAGLVIGLAGAMFLTRLMTTLLFGVRPTDAATFVAVSVCLLLVALLACYIPARRATKVDPLVALRYE